MIIAPAIILVRPQLGENIGKTARAMLNFGLEDLRLVAPRDGWPNPSARPVAAGADRVLAMARVFSDVPAAVADCDVVYATTARRRAVEKSVLSPEAAVRAMRLAGAQNPQNTQNPSITRSALLFGPERSGLDSDDVALVDVLVNIAANPTFTSLNLAQAVIIFAYEWSKADIFDTPDTPDTPDIFDGNGAIAKENNGESVARHAALTGLFEHLCAVLDISGYFHPPERTVATRRTLRHILSKSGWSIEDIQMMRGIIAALARGEKPSSK